MPFGFLVSLQEDSPPRICFDRLQHLISRHNTLSGGSTYWQRSEVIRSGKKSCFLVPSVPRSPPGPGMRVCVGRGGGELHRYVPYVRTQRVKPCSLWFVFTKAMFLAVLVLNNVLILVSTLHSFPSL